MWRRVIWVSCWLTVSAIAACSSGGSSGGKRSNAPVLNITTPAGLQSGDVTIQYSLLDPQSDLVFIVVEFSTDGGSTFSMAADAGPAAGSEGLTGLTSSSVTGIVHDFVWSTGTDLPGAYVPDVRVRITPSDGEQGSSDTTGSFVVDNNSTPSAIVQTPSNPSVAPVTIDYSLIDAQSDTASIQVTYSTDMGFTYILATESVGPPSEGTFGLATSPGPAGTPHVYVWDAAVDIPGAATSVRVRIRPSDFSQGTAGETLDFALITNQRPEAIVMTPASPASGDIWLDYDLIDVESDAVGILVEYSADGGITYQSATESIGPPSEGVTGLTSSPAGVAHVFVWDSTTDLCSASLPAVRLRVTPSDLAGLGIAGESADFMLDNGTGPSATVSTPASPASGDIVIDYVLFEPGSASVDIVTEQSTDSGVTYQPATESGDPLSEGTTGLSSSPAGISHVFVWDSLADVGPNLRTFVRFRITPIVGVLSGCPSESNVFTVDNTTAPSRLYTLDIPLDPAGPDTVNGYDVDTFGALTPMGGAPWPSGGQGRQQSSVSGLVATPQGDFLFATLNASTAVEGYAVGPTGDLTQVPGSPFATVGNPSTLAIHQSGRFLYTANIGDLEAFEVNLTDGTLTTIPGSPFVVGSSLRGMTVHPRGDFLYTGHMFGGDRGVRVHDINPTTGAVSFSSWLDLTVMGARPGKHLTIDPPGIRLFCGDLDAGIFVADIDPTTGALTLVPSAPHFLGAFMSGLTTTQRGDYLYVSDTTTGSSLLGFQVGVTGVLTSVPGSPYSNISPSTLYLRTDATDAFLFTSSRALDHIRVYDINGADGSLSEVSGSPFANPNPSGIVGPVLPYP